MNLSLTLPSIFILLLAFTTASLAAPTSKPEAQRPDCTIRTSNLLPVEIILASTVLI